MIPNHGPTISETATPMPWMNLRLPSAGRDFKNTVEYASMENTKIDSAVMAQNETACSMFATRHQRQNRRRFASSWRTIFPVAASATSWPVTGETMRGMCAPIPNPLSRIQLLCARLPMPPAPANAMAPSTNAASSPPGIVPRPVPNPVTICGTSPQARALIPATITTTRKKNTARTLTVSIFSTVLYTTGDAVRVTPIANSAAIATQVAPDELKPNRKPSTVAPLVAQPGQTIVTKAATAMMAPHGFHSRANPAIAVSPVARVQRSISMFRKNCRLTPTRAAHSNTSPTWVVMYGQSRYSPEPMDNAAMMTLGPSTLRSEFGSGMSA